MFFLASFAFLGLEPVFKCQMITGSDVWTYGTVEDPLETEYCSGDYECEIDWDSPHSLHNLITQLDFECAPKWKLGAIGALFLIGIVVGCSTITKMGD